MMRRAAIAAAAFAVLGACGAPNDEPVGASAQPIIRGADSDASQNAVVLLDHYEGGSRVGASACSGILISPKVVLTARHCVSETEPGGIACSSSGKPISGGGVKGDYKPSAIYVFVGTKRPDILAGEGPVARGASFVHDGATNLCDHDLALVVLDRAVAKPMIAPLRLEGGPQKGDAVTLVGWGLDENSAEPAVRKQRTVTVTGVGGGSGFGPGELQVGEGSCQGDSGGPALADKTRAVLGVLSRGGAPGGGCVGQDADNVYTLLGPYKELIDKTIRDQGGEPWIEGQPSPLLAKDGEACAADGDCRSNACNLQTKTCAQDCATTACSSGLVCKDLQGRRLCATPDDAGGGCRLGPRSGDASALGLVIAAVAAVATGVRRAAGEKRRRRA